MATFPIFGKGFVPEPDKKKRKIESEKNINDYFERPLHKQEQS
jgi:hypothetical protein